MPVFNEIDLTFDISYPVCKYPYCGFKWGIKASNSKLTQGKTWFVTLRQVATGLLLFIDV
jgi:hypothetical protein